MIGEVMLAFALTGMGGVLWERLNSLTRVNPGFDPNHLFWLTYTRRRRMHPGARSSVVSNETA